MSAFVKTAEGVIVSRANYDALGARLGDHWALRDPQPVGPEIFGNVDGPATAASLCAVGSTPSTPEVE